MKPDESPANGYPVLPPLDPAAPPLMLYRQGDAEQDILVLQWWNRLLETGDLSTTFGNGARSLSTFYELIGPPRVTALIIEPSPPRIIGCFLVASVLSGAFVTVWVDPDRRQSPAMREALAFAYAESLQRFPVLLGVCRQPALRKVHEHWGYQLVGEVPALFDGARTWLYALTPEQFRAAQATARARVANGASHVGEA